MMTRSPVGTDNCSKGRQCVGRYPEESHSEGDPSNSAAGRPWVLWQDAAEEQRGKLEITGKFSMTRWRCHFSSPPSLRYPFRLLSTIEPSWPPRYLLTDCLPSIAVSNAKDEIARLE